MRIIIYESSSFGGCYDYSLQLINAYGKQKGVESVTLLLPKTASVKIEGVEKLLLKDQLTTENVLLKKLWFIFRVFINPLILFFYLLFKKKRYVLLNDFEQLSAWLWAPLYRFFLFWHKFAVFLHDPDRDAYPPSTKASSFLMKCMMRTMSVAFYHEVLPQKKYYQNKNTEYIAVPHGIYPAPEEDTDLIALLNKEIGKRHTFALIGNIRQEKNTDLAIKALTEVPNAHLVVAGKAASSSVDVTALNELAQKLGVNDRITWITRFLTEAEMSAVIKRTDVVLLYYRATFVSQSAIINLIAPFSKKLIVSETKSALTETVKKFGNGLIAEADNIEALIEVMKSIQAENENYRLGWQKYLEYASWERNASIAMDIFSKLK